MPISLHAALRIAAVASWIVLILLALAPARAAALRTAAFAALTFLAAFITRMSFRETESRWQIVGFWVLLVMIELSRLRGPGRTARLGTLAFSAVAAFLGVLLAKRILEPGAF